MLNQFLKWQQVSQCIEQAVCVKKIYAHIEQKMRTAFIFLGAGALCILIVMFVRPDTADYLIDLSPFSQAEVTSSEQTDVAAPVSVSLENKDPSTSEQVWVTSWLAKRYRVADDAAQMLVATTYKVAHEVKLDPLLILSVIAIESGFNPFAQSSVGAQGLMQIMSKVHQDKLQPLGGAKVVLDPLTNIKVGSSILKEYVSRGGSVQAGLKMYVGAADFDSDSGYGSKVLSEYAYLKKVALGKKVPPFVTSNINKQQLSKGSDKVSPDAAKSAMIQQADYNL